MEDRAWKNLVVPSAKTRVVVRGLHRGAENDFVTRFPVAGNTHIIIILITVYYNAVRPGVKTAAVIRTELTPERRTKLFRRIHRQHNMYVCG